MLGLEISFFDELATLHGVAQLCRGRLDDLGLEVVANTMDVVRNLFRVSGKSVVWLSLNDHRLVDASPQPLTLDARLFPRTGRIRRTLTMYTSKLLCLESSLHLSANSGVPTGTNVYPCGAFLYDVWRYENSQ